MILDEKFPDYQKLLDVDEAGTPPLTLPRLPDRNPSSGAAPSFSGHKLRGDRFEANGIDDTGA
jgi:hypothetical protein